MKERKAVERLIKRIYDDRLKRTGKLPQAAEARDIERKAAAAAEQTDNRRNRK
jgi:hypothetical protein